MSLHYYKGEAWLKIDQQKKKKKTKQRTATVHGAMGCSQKSFKLDATVTLAPFRVPSQRGVAPSVISVTSVT